MSASLLFPSQRNTIVMLAIFPRQIDGTISWLLAQGLIVVRIGWTISSLVDFLKVWYPASRSQPMNSRTVTVTGFPFVILISALTLIFVGDDCNITCIIDWAFASSVTIAELHTTPGLPHPRDDTEPPLTAAFRAAFMNHLEREDSKILRPAVWETSKKVWLFTRLINLDALQNYTSWSCTH